MASPLSMTTGKTSKNSANRLKWKMKRSEDGEITFAPIKKKTCAKFDGGTIHVTMTSKMIREDKVKDAVMAVGRVGGEVTSVRGRTMTVDVSGESFEEVGDVLDFFGCQWDLQ